MIDGGRGKGTIGLYIMVEISKRSSLLNRISSCQQTVSTENGVKVIKRFKNHSQFQMYRSSDRWRKGGGGHDWAIYNGRNDRLCVSHSYPIPGLFKTTSFGNFLLDSLLRNEKCLAF